MANYNDFVRSAAKPNIIEMREDVDAIENSTYYKRLSEYRENITAADIVAAGGLTLFEANTLTLPAGTYRISGLLYFGMSNDSLPVTRLRMRLGATNLGYAELDGSFLVTSNPFFTPYFAQTTESHTSYEVYQDLIGEEVLVRIGGIMNLSSAGTISPKLMEFPESFAGTIWVGTGTFLHVQKLIATESAWS